MILCLLLLPFIRLASANAIAASDLAASYGLTTSTAFPFPAATQDSSGAQAVMIADWSLSKGKLQNGGDDVSFIADPFPNSPSTGATPDNTTGPVLQVTYPQGSFSGATGGAQLYNLWNSSTPFQSMLITYDVAFDSGFDWVKGGKLPGIRGGPDVNGCSGGEEPNGTDCFSARLMWRTNGEGEVYAYIPTPNGICDAKSILCNDDFGVSISRGSFTFAAGAWNRITMLVQLNSPTNVANGQVLFYFNDILVFTQNGLQFRSGSQVNANGMFFSTFFGGDDKSWATPVTTHTYFRNIAMWAGPNPSNLTGQVVSAAKSTHTIAGSWLAMVVTILAVAGLL